MYDELTETLRFMSKQGMKYGIAVVTMEQAADAIEELQATVEGYESSTNMVFVEKDGETVIEFVPRWIPVTERLPEEDGCYLVAVKNDHQRRYSKTAWFSHGSWFARQDVTHWMELPSAPKEEE